MNKLKNYEINELDPNKTYVVRIKGHLSIADLTETSKTLTKEGLKHFVIVTEDISFKEIDTSKKYLLEVPTSTSTREINYWLDYAKSNGLNVVYKPIDFSIERP